MAEEKKQEDFEFEVENEVEAPEVDRSTPEQIRQDQINAAKQQAKGKPEVDIEVEDDTPEEDRGRAPLPKEIVQELDADELEEYSEKVKTRLRQMKKVWHDERRAKEAALREQQEAISLAQRMLEENRKLKNTLSEGEKTYIDTAKSAAELELDSAKRSYKEAYDAGDSDQILAAQERLSEATYKIQKLKEYKPSLQETEVQVESQPTQQTPRLDPKTAAWQERNPWWGMDEEMTALALGFHQKLEKQYGRQYVGTDEYWSKVDDTMRRRFPDYDWGDEPKTTNGSGKTVTRTETKPATVVAPASRSTSSKKIVLKQSQVALAKKLGLTPEQYAREFAKTLGN
jgi:hypothetical protein